MPYTFEGNVGVVGPGVVAGSAPTVRECVAEKFGDTVKLSWRWPDGDYLMQVSWHRGGLDRTARVTRAKYRADGGFVISPGDGVTDIGVATVIKSADEEWVAFTRKWQYGEAQRAAIKDVLDELLAQYDAVVPPGLWKSPEIWAVMGYGAYALFIGADPVFCPEGPTSAQALAVAKARKRKAGTSSSVSLGPLLPSTCARA